METWIMYEYISIKFRVLLSLTLTVTTIFNATHPISGKNIDIGNEFQKHLV